MRILLCLLLLSLAVSAAPDPGDPGLRLGGFGLAHAAWTLQQGGGLVTVAILEHGQERKIVRFEGDIPKAIARASVELPKEKWADRWVLVWDGFLARPGGGNQDALLAQVVDRRAGKSYWMGLPYKNKPFTLAGQIYAVPGMGLIHSVTSKDGKNSDRRDADKSLQKGLREAMKAHPKFSTLPWVEK